MEIDSERGNNLLHGIDDERTQLRGADHLGSSERKKMRAKNNSIGPGELLTLGQGDKIIFKSGRTL